PSHTPNWRQYTEGGAFMPNLPLMRRIREVVRHDANLIDMASGELSADLFPNELVQELLREQPFTEHLGYDHPQGSPALRTTLARFLSRRHGIAATESSILITSGSQQSLYLITQCLLSPGDAVAIEDPSYCYSLPMFQSAGLRICRLPVYKDGIDPEDVARLYREHRIRMVFLNPNFQNPTGSILSLTKRRRLLEIAAELRIPIVEDDPFSLTSMLPESPQTLKALDKDGIVMYIGSLSKIAAS
ncbi:PLP-dependent aminotransferase family protein, partial [Paenibacillus sepulcri]|nr:PLP-dependent aminotransferase family protein [Paenibacillus sepulcri]